MNIFHKIALKGLFKNRTRTIVTIIGVVLSALMITGVTTFGVSLMDYMVKVARQNYGEWHAACLDADAAFVQKQAQDQGVGAAVSFSNIGYAAVDGGQNPDKPYFFIAGFWQDTAGMLPVTLVSGRFPENDGEVLVSAKVSTDSGVAYKVGDTMELSVGSRLKGDQELTQADPYVPGEENFVPREEKSYTVVGLCRTPVFEPAESPGYTLITKCRTADTSCSQSVFVELNAPRKVYSYAKKIREGHTCILNYDVLRIMGISDRPADKVFLGFLYAFGGIVLGIIMIGSVFLIYNSFSISLNERIREIGVLASVGATAKQLRNSVLFEGLCIGAIGIPIGVLAGLGAIGLILRAVSANIGAVFRSGVPMDMTVSALSVGAAVIVSIVTILISAWLPAKKAVRMPVMECIRQTNEIKVDAGAMEIPQRQQRICGLEGTLALKNFKRNRKKYRSIVLSLVLSIVLFVVTNATIDCLQQGTGRFKTVSDYDIGFGTSDMEDAELIRLYEKLKNVDGISGSSYRAVVSYICTVPADTLSDAYWEAVGGRSSEAAVNLPVTVHFLEDAFYQKRVQEYALPVEEYTGENGKFIAVAKMNSDSPDVEGAEDLEDMFKAESMELTLTPKMSDGAEAGQGQTVSVTAMEILPPDIPPADVSYEAEELPYTFELLVPWSMKEKLAPPGLPVDVKSKGMCFDSEKPAQSTDAMQKILTEEGLTSSYILVNSAEAFEMFRSITLVANVFAYVFIGLISLIAVANVFNTISTNIRLRRRELAMLRSVGMADKNFNRMMRFECALYGIRALVIGIPLSLVLSALSVYVMTVDEVEFRLPWASVGISTLSVFLVIFATMMYAVSKIRKENIIDALRDEMT